MQRIEEQARCLGVSINTKVFATRKSWAKYALAALHAVEQIAEDLDMTGCLHLWPDKSLGTKWVLKQVPDPQAHCDWLNHWWSRISEWPHDA